MGLWHRIFGTSAQGRDPSSDFWYQPIQPGTAASQSVTAERAMQIPAVMDALNALTDPIAHLPLKLFRRFDDGSKEAAPRHPIAQMLRNPADGWTPYEWRGWGQWNLALHANAYYEIQPGPLGAIDELIPHHPDHVHVERVAGRPNYRVTDPDTGRQRDVSPDDMWHLRSLPMDRDGLCGVPPYKTNRETLAHALAVQDYGARFFANDGQAGGFIKPTVPFKSQEDRQRFKKAFHEARAGKNAHKIGVLEHGMEFEKGPEWNNQHAQFLETRKELAIEIARIWSVPPHKIRSMDKATFSNIEEQSLSFVTDTLLPWVRLWEEKIRVDLIEPTTGSRPGGAGAYFAEFNLAGLLRGDLLSRYRAYAIARNWGWMSANDIRANENMNPIEDGDIYLQPQNMQDAGDPSGDPSQPGDQGQNGNQPRGDIVRLAAGKETDNG
ncbi:MAG: phage portal protein [Rhodovibrio sp.]|nr:phage portal protein [Rhodovibrio sp.]